MGPAENLNDVLGSKETPFDVLRTMDKVDGMALKAQYQSLQLFDTMSLGNLQPGAKKETMPRWGNEKDKIAFSASVDTDLVTGYMIEIGRMNELYAKATPKEKKDLEEKIKQVKQKMAVQLVFTEGVQLTGELALCVQGEQEAIRQNFGATNIPKDPFESLKHADILRRGLQQRIKVYQLKMLLLDLVGKGKKAETELWPLVSSVKDGSIPAMERLGNDLWSGDKDKEEKTKKLVNLMQNIVNALPEELVQRIGFMQDPAERRKALEPALKAIDVSYIALEKLCIECVWTPGTKDRKLRSVAYLDTLFAQHSSLVSKAKDKADPKDKDNLRVLNKKGEGITDRSLGISSELARRYANLRQLGIGEGQSGIPYPKEGVDGIGPIDVSPLDAEAIRDLAQMKQDLLQIQIDYLDKFEKVLQGQWSLNRFFDWLTFGEKDGEDTLFRVLEEARDVAEGQGKAWDPDTLFGVVRVPSGMDIPWTKPLGNKIRSLTKEQRLKAFASSLAIPDAYFAIIDDDPNAAEKRKALLVDLPRIKDLTGILGTYRLMLDPYAKVAKQDAKLLKKISNPGSYIQMGQMKPGQEALRPTWWLETGEEEDLQLANEISALLREKNNGEFDILKWFQNEKEFSTPPAWWKEKTDPKSPLKRPPIAVIREQMKAAAEMSTPKDAAQQLLPIYLLLLKRVENRSGVTDAAIEKYITRGEAMTDRQIRETAWIHERLLVRDRLIGTLLQEHERGYRKALDRADFTHLKIQKEYEGSYNFWTDTFLPLHFKYGAPITGTAWATAKLLPGGKNPGLGRRILQGTLRVGALPASYPAEGIYWLYRGGRSAGGALLPLRGAASAEAAERATSTLLTTAKRVDFAKDALKIDISKYKNFATTVETVHAHKFDQLDDIYKRMGAAKDAAERKAIFRKELVPLLNEKISLLENAGISRADARLLVRKGVCGCDLNQMRILEQGGTAFDIAKEVEAEFVAQQARAAAAERSLGALEAGGVTRTERLISVVTEAQNLKLAEAGEWKRVQQLLAAGDEKGARALARSLGIADSAADLRAEARVAEARALAKAQELEKVATLAKEGKVAEAGKILEGIKAAETTKLATGLRIAVGTGFLLFDTIVLGIDIATAIEVSKRIANIEEQLSSYLKDRGYRKTAGEWIFTKDGCKIDLTAFHKRLKNALTSHKVDVAGSGIGTVGGLMMATGIGAPIGAALCVISLIGKGFTAVDRRKQYLRAVRDLPPFVLLNIGVEHIAGEELGEFLTGHQFADNFVSNDLLFDPEIVQKILFGQLHSVICTDERMKKAKEGNLDAVGSALLPHFLTPDAANDFFEHEFKDHFLPFYNVLVLNEYSRRNDFVKERLKEGNFRYDEIHTIMRPCLRRAAELYAVNATETRYARALVLEEKVKKMEKNIDFAQLTTRQKNLLTALKISPSSSLADCTKALEEHVASLGEQNVFGESLKESRDTILFLQKHPKEFGKSSEDVPLTRFVNSALSTFSSWDDPRSEQEQMLGFSAKESMWKGRDERTMSRLRANSRAKTSDIDYFHQAALPMAIPTASIPAEILLGDVTSPSYYEKVNAMLNAQTIYDWNDGPPNWKKNEDHIVVKDTISTQAFCLRLLAQKQRWMLEAMNVQQETFVPDKDYEPYLQAELFAIMMRRKECETSTAAMIPILREMNAVFVGLAARMQINDHKVSVAFIELNKQFDKMYEKNSTAQAEYAHALRDARQRQETLRSVYEKTWSNTVQRAMVNPENKEIPQAINPQLVRLGLDQDVPVYMVGALNVGEDALSEERDLEKKVLSLLPLPRDIAAGLRPTGILIVKKDLSGANRLVPIRNKEGEWVRSRLTKDPYVSYTVYVQTSDIRQPDNKFSISHQTVLFGMDAKTGVLTNEQITYPIQRNLQIEKTDGPLGAFAAESRLESIRRFRAEERTGEATRLAKMSDFDRMAEGAFNTERLVQISQKPEIWCSSYRTVPSGPLNYSEQRCVLLCRHNEKLAYVQFPIMGFEKEALLYYDGESLANPQKYPPKGQRGSAEGLDRFRKEYYPVYRRKLEANFRTAREVISDPRAVDMVGFDRVAAFGGKVGQLSTNVWMFERFSPDGKAEAPQPINNFDESHISRVLARPMWSQNADLAKQFEQRVLLTNPLLAQSVRGEKFQKKMREMAKEYEHLATTKLMNNEEKRRIYQTISNNLDELADPGALAEYPPVPISLSEENGTERPNAAANPNQLPSQKSPNGTPSRE